MTQREAVPPPETPRVLIRPATPEDLDVLVSLARRCPGAAAWSPSVWAQALQPPGEVWVATLGARVVGFLAAGGITEEVEVLNIAVDEQDRGLGVGKRLLAVALHRARTGGARKVHLEVRESNAAARAFYEQAGFVVTRRRVRYYTDPVEDAVLMTLALAPERP